MKSADFKVGQKVIINKPWKEDGLCDVGYIIGIALDRSPDTCGYFQDGGLSVEAIKRRGFADVYIEACDEIIYTVLVVNHTNLEHLEHYYKKIVVDSENLLLPCTKANLKKVNGII